MARQELSEDIDKARVKKPTRRSKGLNPQLGKHFEQQHPIPADEALDGDTEFAESLKHSLSIDDINEDGVGIPLKGSKMFPNVEIEQAINPAPSHNDKAPENPIEYWLEEYQWPKSYFEPDRMDCLLARPSLRRKQSITDSDTTMTPSDQRPREKIKGYLSPGVVTILQHKEGSYMYESKLYITDASKELCRVLLENEQTVPSNTLSRDDISKNACQRLQSRNEAKVIQDVARLIVPSAETLATLGAETLDVLIESVDEGWNNSIPLLGSRPQPDYAVGFERSAFTKEQLTKIDPWIGNIVTNTSWFLGTYYIMNAHSMTLAVRAIAALSRLRNRENKVHREILAFSISHNDQNVRLYGHYPVIDGATITFYRHSIRSFYLTDMDGKDKWTAYKFVKNVYEIWMPKHLARIRSVIDELPSDPDSRLRDFRK